MRKRSKRERSGSPSAISLYVHVPFCRSKCPYCAFYSLSPAIGGISSFLQALEGEIELFKREGDLPRIRTAYIGGGTPSVLSLPDWKRLISILESAFTFLPRAEVTVEANPGSLTGEHLSLWKDWRVTRVSLGVQSLQDKDLLVAGRAHNRRQALDSMAKITGTGLSLSADLLFGLPGQNLRSWGETLREILSQGVDHVSIYQLTLEEGTPWGERPQNDLAEGYPFYRWAQYYLEKKGLLQYEIASFARPGRWCRHNVSYWTGGEFIGLGPSAWGYMNYERTRNIPDLAEYCLMVSRGNKPVCYSERLEGDRLASESTILALRTRWGIRLQDLRRDWCKDWPERMNAALEELPRDLFRSSPGRIALSRRGMRVGNSIWERLLP
jgi:oxygen-independent coproporphyrinogen-3 oxidase